MNRTATVIVGGLILMLMPFVGLADEDSELQESITTALISATEDTDEQVRYAAFAALKDQPQSDAIVATFRRGLNDNYLNTRVLALSKLVDFEGPTDKVLERLISAIEEDTELAPSARNLLAEIGEPAVPRVIKALDSKKVKVRLTVAEMLGSIRLGTHQRKAVSHLTTLLEDENRNVRITAINALKSIAVAESQRISSTDRYLQYAVAFIREV